MWCGVCQQDVPAVPFAENSTTLCCARCRTFFQTESAATESQAESVASRLASRGYSADAPQEIHSRTAGVGKIPSPPPIDFEDWQWENDLRAAAKLLRRVGSIHNKFAATFSANLPDESPSVTSITKDTSSAKSTAQPKPVTNESSKHTRQAKSVHENDETLRSPLLNWIALSVGASVFLGGGILLLGSIVLHRTDLWNLGLPITVLGQIALVVGLVLQLERLRHGNQATRATLEQLDDELRQLREVARLATPAKQSPGHSFRTHLAEGASPRMLLADLKGQLDLLAQRMPDESR